MSSPKGTSKHPQSAMYKDGECKVVEQSEVEALIADGWYNNPADALNPPEKVEVDESDPGAGIDQTPEEETTSDADAEETADDSETDPAADEGDEPEEPAAEDSGTDEAE